MEGWAEIAERFGLPVVMLLGMSWGAVHLFKWLANDLMRQLQDNASRIEAIVIKLIDNSKKERAEHREESKVRDQQMTTLIDLMVKLTGNGLSGKK
tara:strand:+ start:2994 stop:3281 length:288 start_codon:yes stop_codon:yes gene_type:complete